MKTLFEMLRDPEQLIEKDTAVAQIFEAVCRIARLDTEQRIEAKQLCDKEIRPPSPKHTTLEILQLAGQIAGICARVIQTSPLVTQDQGPKSRQRGRVSQPRHLVPHTLCVSFWDHDLIARPADLALKISRWWFGEERLFHKSIESQLVDAQKPEDEYGAWCAVIQLREFDPKLLEYAGVREFLQSGRWRADKVYGRIPVSTLSELNFK